MRTGKGELAGKGKKMKKTKECNWGQKLLTLVSTFALVLTLGLLAEPFSTVCSAESQGKVTASSAKIRKEASTSSTSLGSATKDSTVSIRSQVTGSDGMVWYEVFVDADTLGFIRSDLVQITDGTTPPTGTGTPSNNTGVNTNENMPEVTAVEPMSASVTGSQSVRVRSNASTGSQIVTMAQSGLALTVNGQANGTDGKVWYQVSFISEGNQVTGFIRSDYVALDGELVPVTETENPSEEQTPEEPETPAEPEEPVVETKDWDTKRVEGKWYLIDNVEEGSYEINYIFESVTTNKEAYEQAHSKVKSQRVWIIILVILVVAMAAAIAFLVFKIKDMVDSAYFAEVEKETIRRRTGERVSSQGRVMHTVGAEKRPVQGGQRPAGARPAGAPAQGGQRPAGARPAGAPAQGGQRPAGARPAGAPAQGGQRPAGARPAGAPAQDSQRPAEASAQGAATPKAYSESNTENPGWKSKNFMAEEDEFEFEFLNWDGEDEQ